MHDDSNVINENGHFNKMKGAQIPGMNSLRQLNFMQWCLIFVGPQYGAHT